MIKTLYLLWKNRKALDIPGWGYVVVMVIGLIFLLFAIWLVARAGREQVGILGRL